MPFWPAVSAGQNFSLQFLHKKFMQVSYIFLALYCDKWYTNINQNQEVIYMVMWKEVGISDVDELIFGSDESVVYSER